MQAENGGLGSWIGYSAASATSGLFGFLTQMNWFAVVAVVVPILPPVIRDVCSWRKSQREVARLRTEVRALRSLLEIKGKKDAE